jgi:hypothetical protein
MIRRIFALTSAAVLLVAIAAPKAAAQVSFGVNVGPAPVCPYGYFAFPPYGCAPYGYYGPSWFNNGVFVGAGPWFRGPDNWRGPVNSRFDPRFGYRGAYPPRGARPAPGRPPGRVNGFRGNQFRNGRGQSVR